MVVELENKYAVVGLGCVFPDAENVEQFWKNIIEKRVSIGKLPEDSPEREVYFRPEVLGRAEKGDRSYTDLLAPVRHIAFDSKRFRIPPATAAQMDDNQKLSLLVAEEAMSMGALGSVSNDRVCVIMGNTMIGMRHHHHKGRIDCDKYEYYLGRHPAFISGLSEEARQQLILELRGKIVGPAPGVNEDTAPGILPNIIAARINSVFDFHGHAYVVDAACASGLAAIILGVQQLRLGEADAVICGAADLQNEEMGRIYFSGIGALSPNGSFPFDERADGFVVGDGAGAVVIKRLVDAISRGDKIRAVIAGYGQASDGKGKAVAAPNDVWQARTIERAWRAASAPADTIELIEAHGTATQVGDISEIKALKKSFETLGAKGRHFCGIGSVKSNIGHLKSAAGIAGFVKAVLALDKKILPPTAGFLKENPKLALADSPFYVLDEPREWSAKEHPRRAGVSAFGFGGADYHIALEEFRSRDYEGVLKKGAVQVPLSYHGGTDKESISVARESQRSDCPTLSTPDALLFSGPDERSVVAAVEACAADLMREPERLERRLALQNMSARADHKVRLGLVLHSTAELWTQLEQIKHWAARPDGKEALAAKGIAFQKGERIRQDQIVVLFPGQGSQYADMLAPLFDRYASARQSVARADALWQSLSGRAVSDLWTSRADGLEKTEERLRDTGNTHPAVVTASTTVYGLLREMGLRPAAMLGHSVGELTALAASRKLRFDDAMTLVHARATAFSHVPEDARGAMAALPLNVDETLDLLRRLNIAAVVANINSPSQTIVSGSVSDMERIDGACLQKNIRCVRLNVSHAFHSPLMAKAEAAFQQSLANVEFCKGDVPVMASGTVAYYGDTAAEAGQILQHQITGPVRFRHAVERLYDEGMRLFIEVGPSAVLTALTRSILADKPVTVLASDNRRGNSLDAFLGAVCGLFAAGVDMDPTRPAKGDSADSVTLSSQSAPSSARRDSTMDDPRPAMVYSGVAVGLPGSYKDSFRDDNFEQLFEGRNLIEQLSDAERQKMVDLDISKVVKSAQGASFKELKSLTDVIQLAGKMGVLHMEENYQIEEKDVLDMSSAIAAAVAAGYEALKDAQIPLVHEYTKTAGGSMLPERWSLPQPMQAGTGVIFANGFPMVEPIIEEVSRHLGGRLGNQAKEALFEMYDSLIENVTDKDARKKLLDWYVTNRDRLAPTPGPEQVYRFNYRLMTQIAMQANNRLARFLNARGPNFQINAACSSTCTAVALAESLIQTGKADTMIVIGGDDPTSTYAMPYLGAGFLSTGACTDAGNLYEAALPFDKRRRGMIMGAGAVGIVIEKDAACTARGIVPVCDLLGTHCFNAAAHGSQLDVPRYADELDKFMARMEKTHALSRPDMAKKMVYLSHETYTPARGGCAESEAVALEFAFGEAYREIEIGNTKGMTGHTMGASIEDATAAKALQFGKAPPVVNHRVTDPVLEGLKLSSGEPGDFEYALRMAAGFGSQGNYILLRRRALGDRRIENPSAYTAWLTEISKDPTPEVSLRGRVLSVMDRRPGAVLTDRPDIGGEFTQRRSSLPFYPSSRPSQTPSQSPSRSPSPSMSSNAPPTADLSASRSSTTPKPSMSNVDARALVIRTVAEITGYEAAMLEMDMDLEADLGVDTVKQATVIATLAERLALEDLESLTLSEYPTLGHLVTFCENASGKSISIEDNAPPSAAPSGRMSTHPAPPVKAVLSKSPNLVRAVVAEVSGYAESILEADMELEADLGIDTVKQATIWSILAERLGISEDASIPMSAFSTIRKLEDYFSASTVAPAAAMPVPTPMAPRAEAESTVEKEIELFVFRAIAGLCAYPAEMLEADLRIESDLAMDAASGARLEAALQERFSLDVSWRLPKDARLDALCDAVRNGGRQLGPASAPEQWIGRRIVTLTPSPITADRPVSLSGKKVWVVGDDARCVSILSAHLSAQGSRVDSIVFPQQGEVPWTVPSGAPDILIDLTATPLSEALLDQPTQAVSAGIERAMDRRFELCRGLAEQKRTPARILVVTAIDGCFALGDRARKDQTTAVSMSSLYGLHLGFYKAVRKEWPSSTVSMLDLPPAFWQTDAVEALTRIEAELTAAGEGVEVCFLDGNRMRVITEASALEVDAADPVFAHDDVAVVTGGGAGITAHIAMATVERGLKKLALIGRTQMDETKRPVALDTPEAVEREKETIRLRLAATTARVTPVMIERELSILRRRNDIMETIDTLKQLGAQVRYYAADVADPWALEAVLKSVRKDFGPITILVHGAGAEISHRLEKKTAEEFRSVYRPKAVGACQLLRLCTSDPIRCVVLISSISGRFGNAAQTDYAGANAFLDLTARVENRPGVRALCLLFSGWSQSGMAWRNTFVRENAEKGGLNFIDPKSGAAAAALEAARADGPCEVILHRGLADIIGSAETDVDLTPFPLVDFVEKKDGVISAVHRRFSPARDAFLDQHRLAEIPLMPGVGFMEMMAEAARVNGAPKGSAFVYRDLAFTDAFKLHRDAPRDVRIEMTPGQKDGEICMTVQSRFKPRMGLSAEVRVYARAWVTALPSSEISTSVVHPDLKNAKVTTWSTVLDAAADRKQNVRFGPLFNEAKRSKAERLSSEIRWSDAGIETLVPLPKEQLSHPGYPLDRWLVNPAFLDTLHQAGAVLAIQRTGSVYLPVGAEEFVVFHAPDQDALYRVSAALIHLDEDAARYDMSMVREDGLLCATVRGSLFRRIHD